MSKHVKGPWRVTGSPSEEWIEAPECGELGDVICVQPSKYETSSRKNWERNKHLVSASPEMYQLLIELRKYPIEKEHQDRIDSLLNRINNDQPPYHLPTNDPNLRWTDGMGITY